MIPSEFLPQNSLRRCCILCLVAMLLLCVATLRAQTDSLRTESYKPPSSFVRYGVYPTLEVSLGTIGGGLGGLVGALAGASLATPFAHSAEGFEVLIPAMIGGSIGIVTGSAFVVNRIGQKTRLNASYGKTLIGSALGFGAAVTYYTHFDREIDFVFCLFSFSRHWRDTFRPSGRLQAERSVGFWGAFHSH